MKLTRGRPSQDGVRVLYIGGWGRSGSTLLDRILGRAPGFVAVGELRDLFLRGPVEDRLCGCGCPFSTCPFWQEVGRIAFGGWDRADAGRLASLRSTLDRPWNLLHLLRPDLSTAYADRHREYLNAVTAVYRAVHDVTDGATIVDSSKIPSYALLLRGIPGSELRVVHLRRDSRGVVFSWRKHVMKVDRPDAPEAMHRYGVVPAALRYDAYNAMTECLRLTRVPVLPLRYEDLVRRPAASLARVIEFAGGDASAASTVASGPEIVLEPGHGLDGNPMRFTHGIMALREDDEWRRSMPSRDRRVVTALTSPMLSRYGYGLRG